LDLGILKFRSGDKALGLNARKVSVPDLHVTEPPAGRIVAIWMLEILKELIAILSHLVAFVMATVVRRKGVPKFQTFVRFMGLIGVGVVVCAIHDSGVFLDVSFEVSPEAVELGLEVVGVVFYLLAGDVFYPFVVILGGILWVDGVADAVWFEHGIEGLLSGFALSCVVRASG
jgi:hypothetical protein